MDPEQSSEPFIARARDTLTRSARLRRRHTTRAVMRYASVMAINGTRSVGRRASTGARDAVENAVNALGAMGGETRAFIRDAVVGVVEGTRSGYDGNRACRQRHRRRRHPRQAAE